jgi:hypothetical protein
MQKKIFDCVICALMIITTIVVAEPSNTSSNTGFSSIISYQIGFNNRDENITWSPWMSDENIVNVSFDHLKVPSSISIRIEAPGYYIEYQVGFKNRDENITWSAWASDGNIANVTGNFLRLPATWYLKINAPGYYIEYQIGFKNRDENISWSAYAADGNIANVTFSHLQLPSALYMKALMIVPIKATTNIDPDTLNLKSKGRWITCYIDLPEGHDVNDIDISTILLEDTIPVEWGDVQGTTLMVKFERSEVEDYIGAPQDAIELLVAGKFYDGTEFEGSDTIRVICPP